jgi:hypothetical protein
MTKRVCIFFSLELLLFMKLQSIENQKLHGPLIPWHLAEVRHHMSSLIH